MSAQDVNVTQVAADILVEFLEVAFHTILYIRQVYPQGIFDRRKKYNVPVQMSCHPEVTKYIATTLESVRPLLEQRLVEKVVLVVLNSRQKPIERFVFQISPPEQPSVSEDADLLRLEQSLRAFLLKVNMCDGLLTEPPADCSWRVQVHTKDSSALSLQQKQCVEDLTWIPADADQLHMVQSSLLPLKAMTSDVVKLQLYVEESGTKDS